MCVLIACSGRVWYSAARHLLLVTKYESIVLRITHTKEGKGWDWKGRRGQDKE